MSIIYQIILLSFYSFILSFTMDIEDTIPSDKPKSVPLDKRNECLPSDLVPARLHPLFRDFLYNLFTSFQDHPDIHDWPV